MARITVAQLLERIEALEAEIAALKEQQVTAVQYVAEVRPPKPVSGPIDFNVLLHQTFEPYSHWVESEEEWGPHRYL